MKKTIIICFSLVAAAITGMVFILTNYYTWPQASASSSAAAETIITEDMTYEQFESYLSDSLSKEAQNEAERLFYEIQDAVIANDSESLEMLLLEFNSLNLFTRTSSNSISTSAVSSDTDETEEEKDTEATNIELFIECAESLMGLDIPYVWGGKTTSGFDCSGFVYYCLNKSGYEIEYMTSSAWANSSYKTISSIRKTEAGDILCFDGHVAICIGDGKMIECTSTVNGIRIIEFQNSSYYRNKWVCAKRIFE